MLCDMLGYGIMTIFDCRLVKINLVDLIHNGTFFFQPAPKLNVAKFAQSIHISESETEGGKQFY